MAFSALRGERVALAGGIVLINDCYNANPMSMRAALDDLAASAPARRVAVLGDMLELGPSARPAYHRELAEQARARGVELLITVGPLAARDGARPSPARLHCVADAAAAARAAAPGCSAPATPCSSRARAASASSSSPSGSPSEPGAGLRRAGDVGRSALMGRILIGGTAALLICIFLSPKFIEFLRKREFGQQIREEGPRGTT